MKIGWPRLKTAGANQQPNGWGGEGLQSWANRLESSANEVGKSPWSPVVVVVATVAAV